MAEINVKDIHVKAIDSKSANAFVKRYHYSGKVVNNSQLHFGCFYANRLHGVLSFGPSLDKSKVIGLVKDTKWNEFVELNRMAFDDFLPRNSESRCISVCIRLIRKNCPHIKWIISFADATQCGDGTIYRASGFVLTGIKENNQIYELPDGYKFAQSTVTMLGPKGGEAVRREIKQRVSRTTMIKSAHILSNGASSMKGLIDAGAKPLKGFQLRYIFLIDKSSKLTVPVLPFSRIDELKAGMYKGETIAVVDRKPAAVAQMEVRPASQPGDDVRVDPAAPSVPVTEIKQKQNAI